MEMTEHKKSSCFFYPASEAILPLLFSNILEHDLQD